MSLPQSHFQTVMLNCPLRIPLLFHFQSTPQLWMCRQDVLSVNHLSETHVHAVICSPEGIFISSFSSLLKDYLHSLTQQMSGLQILAFLSGVAGLGATIGATVSNEWRATSRASSVITATWVLQGLWNNCAGNAIGSLHCRPHHTILQLEGKFRNLLFPKQPEHLRLWLNNTCIMLIIHLLRYKFMVRYILWNCFIKYSWCVVTKWNKSVTFCLSANLSAQPSFKGQIKN